MSSKKSQANDVRAKLHKHIPRRGNSEKLKLDVHERNLKGNCSFNDLLKQNRLSPISCVILHVTNFDVSICNEYSTRAD